LWQAATFVNHGRMSRISLQLTGSHKRTATHVQGDLLVTALADNRKLIEV